MRLAIALFLLLQPIQANHKLNFKDLELSYPSNLTPLIDQVENGPIVLTNFDGNYIHGGILPKDGMEITISTTDMNWRNRGNNSQKPTGGFIISRSVTRLGGQRAVKVSSQMDYSVIKMAFTCIYADFNSKRYQICLETHRDEPSRPIAERTFKTLLNSARFNKK